MYLIDENMWKISSECCSFVLFLDYVTVSPIEFYVHALLKSSRAFPAQAENTSHRKEAVTLIVSSFEYKHLAIRKR